MLVYLGYLPFFCNYNVRTESKDGKQNIVCSALSKVTPFSNTYTFTVLLDFKNQQDPLHGMKQKYFELKNCTANVPKLDWLTNWRTKFDIFLIF